MTSKVIVSTIIPAFNSGEFVGDAINSVLRQTRPSDEIIVVDDGSTDDTAEVSKRFGGSVRYLQQENRGPSAARNAGIRAARGNLLCFLDADDLWLPHKLERQLDFMLANPSIGLAFTDQEERDLNNGRVVKCSVLSTIPGGDPPECPLLDPVERLAVKNFISMSTVMIRRECFDSVGLFDEELQLSEDRDLWARVAACFPIAAFPHSLTIRRLHCSNISSNKELTISCRMRFWKKIYTRFPEQFPKATLNALLAKAHLQLALLRLEQKQNALGRYNGLESLRYALQSSFRKSKYTPGKYPWLLGCSIVPASFLGMDKSRRLGRVFTSSLKTSEGERVA